MTPEGQDPSSLSLSAVIIAGGTAGLAMWTLAIPPDVRSFPLHYAIGRSVERREKGRRREEGEEEADDLCGTTGDQIPTPRIARRNVQGFHGLRGQDRQSGRSESSLQRIWSGHPSCFPRQRRYFR